MTAHCPLEREYSVIGMIGVILAYVMLLAQGVILAFLGNQLPAFHLQFLPQKGFRPGLLSAILLLSVLSSLKVHHIFVGYLHVHHLLTLRKLCELFLRPLRNQIFQAAMMFLRVLVPSVHNLRPHCQQQHLALFVSYIHMLLRKVVPFVWITLLPNLGEW